jgi:hypothetical protein
MPLFRKSTGGTSTTGTIRPVTRVSVDGTSTDYPPAANTDVARGAALAAAIAALVGSDLIKLGTGGFSMAATGSGAAMTISGQGESTHVYSAAAGTPALKGTGGTLSLSDMKVSTGGVEINAGSVSARNVRIDTSASALDVPIKRTGAVGSVTLKFCDLKAHASVASLTSGGSAMAVTALASSANKDPDVNVTISPPGGLLVDTTAP